MKDLFGKEVPPVKAQKGHRSHGVENRKKRKDGNRTDRSTSATEGADPWYIYHTGRIVKVSIFAEELKVTERPTGRNDRPPPTRTAGDITTFSDSSRRRLISVMKRTHTESLGEPIFITLTSRHGMYTQEEFQYRFHKKFLPGLREIIPDLVYLWRLEPHKSGKPHYHLVCWSWKKEAKLISEFYKRPIRHLWRECIGDHSKAAQLYSCKIQSVASREKLMKYVSKYLAKEDYGKALEIDGRRWGRSKNYPCSSIAEIIMPMKDYNVLLQIINVILKSKGKDTDWLAERVNDAVGWSMWLNRQETVAVLEYIGLEASLWAYNTYWETGKVLKKNERTPHAERQSWEAMLYKEPDNRKRNWENMAMERPEDFLECLGFEKKVNESDLP